MTAPGQAPMPDVTPEATPGEAAYEAAVDTLPPVVGALQVAYAALHADTRRYWEAAAEAVAAPLRGRLLQAEAELTMLRADLADAEEKLERWPRCPDGCGCRMDGEDADRRECGCDGPCTMECRENGYPGAPSYRDLAVQQYRAVLAPEAMAARYHRALAAAHADGRPARRWRDLGLPEQEAWREGARHALETRDA